MVLFQIASGCLAAIARYNALPYFNLNLEARFF